jgi:hypothetical protein
LLLLSGDGSAAAADSLNAILMYDGEFHRKTITGPIPPDRRSLQIVSGRWRTDRSPVPIRHTGPWERIVFFTWLERCPKGGLCGVKRFSRISRFDLRSFSSCGILLKSEKRPRSCEFGADDHELNSNRSEILRRKKFVHTKPLWQMVGLRPISPPRSCAQIGASALSQEIPIAGAEISKVSSIRKIRF